MRPVFRPPAPPIKYRDYKSFLPYLLAAYGQHCVYCERMTKLDVEHVIPQSKPAGEDLVLDWGNLLLACARCNRDFKGNKNDDRNGFIWPDQTNTFQTFDYKPDGRVLVAQRCRLEDRQSAQNLLDLVVLDDSKQKQMPLNLHRRTQFKIANIALRQYQQGFQTLEEVVIQAKSAWSVWVTVFNRYSEVVDALGQSIPGTNADDDYLID